MNMAIFNSVCYTVGWFWCVIWGSRNQSLLAVGGAAFLIFTELWYAKRNSPKLYLQDILLGLFSLFGGILLEIVFIQLNAVQYAHQSSFFPPLWILALYPLFALLLNHSLRIITKNYWLPSLLGLLVAPFSYFFGAKLGGLTFPYSFFITWAILGIGWALFLCLLSKAAKAIEKAANETFNESETMTPLKLLYDGDCPICNREVCQLQKRKLKKNMQFVNIASKSYSAKENGQVEYETAMRQIVAINNKGRRLIGIPAFAAVYARCNLPMVSTLLRIPLIETIANPAYALFAKNRLWLTGRGNK